MTFTFQALISSVVKVLEVESCRENCVNLLGASWTWKRNIRGGPWWAHIITSSVTWEPSWRCLWTEFVCKAIDLLVLLSWSNIFTCRRHLKSLKFKGKFLVNPQIWTGTCLTVCLWFLYLYFFSSESDFCTIGPPYFYPVSKTFCNFWLQLNMTEHTHAFWEPRVQKNKKVF